MNSFQVTEVNILHSFDSVDIPLSIPLNCKVEFLNTDDNGI